MTWQDDARRAWSDHQAAEQEAAEQEAAATVDYLVRLTETLHLRPTAGTARLGEPRPDVLGVPGHREVRLRLVTEPGEPWVELRAAVDRRALPVVHAWVNWRRDPTAWVDRGPVSTVADLGGALDVRHTPLAPDADAKPAREESTGDMLETILRAIVTEVVHDVINGRLGSGPP